MMWGFSIKCSRDWPRTLVYRVFASIIIKPKNIPSEEKLLHRHLYILICLHGNMHTAGRTMLLSGTFEAIISTFIFISRHWRGMSLEPTFKRIFATLLQFAKLMDTGRNRVARSTPQFLRTRLRSGWPRIKLPKTAVKTRVPHRQLSAISTTP